VIFLGSTIGNLHPEERITFYRRVRTMLNEGDFLMVGYDLVKQKDLLEKAYNDSRGVTAEFNKNILEVVNRELGAEFPVDDFRHVSRYDEEEAWIVSGLVASRAMTIPVPGAGLDVRLRAGETIRTEISAKFTREVVVRELDAGGLVLDSWRTDDEDWFALGVSRGGPEHTEDGR
jgi:L-histidine N-alpha-methyltransferase